MAAAFFIIGGVFILLGAALIGVYIIFSRYPQFTAKAYAAQKKTVHQKNVRMSSGGRYMGRSSRIEKHVTYATYVYKVNGRSYKFKDMTIGTPKQAPRSLPMVYIKGLPWLFYINDEYSIGSEIYVVWSLAPLLLSVIFLLIGFLC